MHVILVSKDMLPVGDLPIYGNRTHSTPHIDCLAAQGTVFKRCISPGSSSAMSYSCIMVGRQPYELRSDHLESQQDIHCEGSIFAAFARQGFKSAVVWDKYWTLKGRHHALKIYDRSTEFHSLDIYHEIGIHRQGRRASVRSQAPGTPSPLAQILACLSQIRHSSEDTFTWLHCPHVLAGHTSIGADIEYFDEIVGELVGIYGRENLYLTSDHGHMDFHHGEILYGKTMNQQVLQVPLICPPLPGVGPVVDRVFSSVRLKELILEKRVVFDPFIFSINQLPHQPNRVLTIVRDRFKYWYFKKYDAEALYDLEFDPLEQRNLLLEEVYSRAKKRTIAMHQAIAYSAWGEAEQAYGRLRQERERVWFDPGFWSNTYGLCKALLRDGIGVSLRDRFFPRTRMPGRWGSAAVSQYCHF